jgi:hypothetical protein
MVVTRLRAQFQASPELLSIHANRNVPFNDRLAASDENDLDDRLERVEIGRIASSQRR